MATPLLWFSGLTSITLSHVILVFVYTMFTSNYTLLIAAPFSSDMLNYEWTNPTKSNQINMVWLPSIIYMVAWWILILSLLTWWLHLNQCFFSGVTIATSREAVGRRLWLSNLILGDIIIQDGGIYLVAGIT